MLRAFAMKLSIFNLCMIASLVALVSFSIYKKTSAAKAPPVYDALSYYEKAINVWKCVYPSITANPFYASPGNRPPGSVPIIAPFGTDISEKGFQWFYFRNLLAPFLLWLLACLLAFPAQGDSRINQGLGIFFACSVSLLPMFFNMEPNSTTGMGYWGLQDTLLASISALSLSLLLAGLNKQSKPATVAAFALAGYTLWIKPSGILVIGIVTTYWLLEVGARLVFTRRKHPVQRIEPGYLIWCFPFAVLTPVAFVLAALRSSYLTKETVSSSIEAQKVVVDIFAGKHLEAFVLLVNRSVGFLWAVVFLAVLVVCIGGLAQKKFVFEPLSRLRILYFSGTLVGGFFWWYDISGPIDRYFFPFVLLAIVGIGNPAWNFLNRALSQRGKKIFSSVFFCMAAFPLVVLLHGDPPRPLESFLGINLRSGGYLHSIAAGDFIVKKSRGLPGPIQYYIIEPDWDIGYVESTLSLSGYASKDNENKFLRASSFQWRRNNVFQASQLVESRFILLNRNNVPGHLDPIMMLGTFDQELHAVKYYLNAIGPQDGVHKQFFSNVCVIEVEDRSLFKISFSLFISRHRWRTEFYDQNPEFTRQP